MCKTTKERYYVTSIEALITGRHQIALPEGPSCFLPLKGGHYVTV